MPSQREIPDYADAGSGKENWLKQGKNAERTAYYKSLYEKKSVKARAERDLQALKVVLGDSIKQAPSRIKPGDTLGKYLLRLSNKSTDLMFMGLNSLQSQGYQVDFFPAGYQIDVSDNRLSIFKEVGGEREYYVSPDTGVPVQALILFPEPTSPADSPPEEDIDGANEKQRLLAAIVDEREMILDEVRAAVGSKTTIVIEMVDRSDPLNPDFDLHLSFEDKKASIRVRHKKGTAPEDYYQSKALVVDYGGNTFDNIAKAAFAASHELSPSSPGHVHVHFNVNETLSLQDQWKQWQDKILGSLPPGIEANFSDIRGRSKRIVLKKGKRKAQIRIIRTLTTLNKGGWTSEHVKITYKGDDHFHNPIEAVESAIAELEGEKPKGFIPPWKLKNHVHPKN